MRRLLLLWVTFFCLLTPVLAQLGNGVFTGTVQDPSNAIIPGVTVTARNTQTGVETAVLTNEAGVYNMPNLIPGTYTLRASLPGFQPQIYQNIDLGGNQTRRFNFTLQISQARTDVEVSVDAQQLLTQSGGTIGDVLPETAVRTLPLVGNDVLDLVNVLGGVSLAPTGSMNFSEAATGAGSRFTTLAGVSATYVNTTVNGLSVTDNFYAGIGEPDNTSGILSVTRVNPELVAEVRLILTPVDAELGRGNGQVQLTTRSGTNRFSGSARWDVRNPALNARSWVDNSTLGGPPTQDWYNQNQFTISYGGPILRNKTFFFALWDQQMVRSRTNVNNTVLTPCARNGIFRYFPNWVNDDALAITPTLPTAAANPARAVVDLQGNPVRPDRNPNNTDYTDTLRYVSVFGPIDFANFPATVAPDCSNIRLLNGSQQGASSPSTAWDPSRWNFDPTGFVAKVMGEMPLPNNYETGDGLNTAGNRYVRGSRGVDGGGFLGAVGTTSDSTNRKQINLKIDHNFTASHKLGTQWSYERNDAFTSAPNYEQGFWGSVRRRPHTFSANFNSTFGPTMVNEFRFGLRRTNNKSLEAMDDPKFREAARDFFPVINGIPVVTSLSIVGSPMMSAGNATQGNITRTLTFSDTLSWTRGEHSFRFGGEVRLNHSDVFNNINVIPRVAAGAGQAPVGVAACNNCDFETFLDGNTTYGNGNGNHFQDGNQSLLENLLLLQSGSIGNITQFYFVEYADRLNQFESFSTEATRSRIWKSNEMAFFVQDDWKMTRNLTTNLGLRWEYYGVPWEDRGLLPAPVGGKNLPGVFGISGKGWEDWWQANPETRGSPTVMEHIGKNSLNPGRSLYPRDLNNFGPVVGFSWSIPWFGEGKTVLRGGYSITFQGGGNVAALDGTAGEIPGAIWSASLGAAANTYRRLADFGTSYKAFTTPTTFNFRDYPFNTVVPLPPDGSNPNLALRPMAPVPLRFRPLGGVPTEFYDDNYVAPYVQNFTLSVTRNIGRRMTLDVRYVGTVARKLFAEAPVNSPNFLTNGLKEAFDLARAGQESQLLNDLTSSVNFRFGNSGAQWLRAQTTGANMANMLAAGNYAGLADQLAFTNGSIANGGIILNGEQGEAGLVLKRSVNARFPNGAPDNFIIANPQFGPLNIVSNTNSSNYHSMQTQFTLRPTHGFSYQTTFTWSRMLGSPTAVNQGNGSVSFYSMHERHKDYGLQFQHRKFDFRSHGTFTLPIGPNKLLFGNSSGFVARLIEDWQLSTIFNMSSGMPNTIVGRSALYESLNSSNFGFPPGNLGPVDLSPEGLAALGDFTRGIGKVDWKDGAARGTYFPGFPFVRIDEPQCENVTNLAPAPGATTLRDRCKASLTAVGIVAPDGRRIPVFQNSQPGTRGNLGTNTIEGPGIWTLDASMSKSFVIDDRRKLQIRFDATNVLNHATPCSPGFCPGTARGTNLSLNNANDFGMIGVKSAINPRQFQGSLRVDF